MNQLVNASRILAYHGIADDSVGHISMRDPQSPNTTFLVTGGSRTAAQVTPADIAVVRINDSVVLSAALTGYPTPPRPAEIFIHSSIYQRLPNTTVSSIAYFQAEQLLPWALYPANTTNATTSEEAASDPIGFYAATAGAAFMGVNPAPIFDVFDAEPGTDSVAVDNTLKGYALAQTFESTNALSQTVNQSDGVRPLVLMRNDGATVVGTTVPETVFRFIQAAKNARVLYHASSLASANRSEPQFLPSVAIQSSDTYLRSWSLWMSQIEPSINADATRNPDLWKGNDDSGSGPTVTNGAAALQPKTLSVSILAIGIVLVPLTWFYV